MTGPDQATEASGTHQARIGSDHPALPGHFPGSPVVPGAIILSQVLAAARAAWPERVVVGLRKVKFLHTIEPDQAFDVELGAPDDDRVAFICRQDSTVRVRGRLLLQTPA